MAKSMQRKEQELQLLQEKLDRSKGVVFANYVGLTVNQVQELRSALRAEDSEMVVVKRTLINRAFKDAEVADVVTAGIEGAVAVVFGYGDEVAPAKVLAEFGKTNEAVQLKAAILDGALIDQDGVIALSKLPSKQELLAKMVGSLKSPMSGMVNVLNGNLRGLVQVLSQIKDQKA